LVSACRRLRQSPLPDDLRATLEALEADFASPLSKAARCAAAQAALAALEGSADPRWSERMLDRPLTALAGVGPKRAERLAGRELRVVSDLLFHLPSSYDDRRSLVRVCDLEVGLDATFIAEVKSVGSAPTRRGGRLGKVLTARVSDGTASIDLIWFRAGDALARSW
jgi:hypothetical protein